MKTLDLLQGSPEWHKHRATHFNASDAPAMMGCSPYETRSELIHRLATGIQKEVDAATQRRFDEGHRIEALARPMAEKIIGETLYPVTGSSGKLSASFDGLTMGEDTAFEHKTMNSGLYGQGAPWGDDFDIPMMYRVQMEQQCLVSGASRVLFMASRWDGDELDVEQHCWYTPDMKLRNQIVGGWVQLEADVAAYVPSTEPVAEKVVAESIEALPAPVVKVSGQLTLSDNFKVFEQSLRDFIENKLIRAPKTDEDFVNLDAQIKAMKAGREALKSAKAQMLAQVQPVDQASKTADMLDKLLQQNCAMAETMMKDEKDRRKTEIVTAGAVALQKHVADLNARLGKPYMPTALSTADFGGSVKGMRSLASMEDAVSTLLANAKIKANEVADSIQANLAIMRELASQHAFLFADTATLVLKAADDLTAVVQSRIAVHEKAEAEKLEAQREQIRAEELARIQREQAAEDKRLRDETAASAQITERQRIDDEAAKSAPAQVMRAQEEVSTGRPVVGAQPSLLDMPAVLASAPAETAQDTPPTLKLGEINARLAPIQLTEAGLAELGFNRAGKQQASVMYHERDFSAICAALVEHIRSVHNKQAA